MLRPIPTPKFVSCPGGERHFPRSAAIALALDEPDAFLFGYLRDALLDEHGLEVIAGSPRQADILITGTPAPFVAQAQVDALSRERYGASQGYVLVCAPNAPVVLYAPSREGRLNAAATLLELMQPSPDGATLSEVSVVDAPDFAHRGNSLLLYAETSGWSYDFGDGEEGFFRRMERELNLCVRHKINVLLADGMGWSVEKTPRYKDILLRLNRMARERGIHLVSAGYGGGYGASAPGNGNLHQGMVHRNLGEDGKPYGCMSLDGRAIFTGSCLSCEASIEARARELTGFVRQIEPGALYLHNLDAWDIHEAGWADRCDACRARWPNDDLFAADGMAGAYAEFYGKMARAVRKVKTPSGYDASKDLLLMLVSPGYGWYFQSDRAWRDTYRYWARVGELMEPGGVYLTFREQYYDNQAVPQGISTERRFDQMRAEFDARCPEMGTAVIYFGGSDGYYSDRLFCAVPAMHYTQAGVDLLLNADGNAYQEPLQLLNAEYMWNSAASAFYNLEKKPRNYFEALALLKQAAFDQFRPDGLYGESGFLRDACQKLYGPEVGRVMQKVFGMCGENGMQPIAYLRNVDLCTPIFFNPPYMAWHNELSDWESRRILSQLKEAARLTREAAEITAPLLDQSGVPEVALHMARCFRDNVPYLDALVAHMELRGRLLAAIQAGAADARLQADLAALQAEAARLRALKTGEALDYMGAALAGQRYVSEFLSRDAGWMLWCLENGKRLPDEQPERHEWW